MRCMREMRRHQGSGVMAEDRIPWTLKESRACGMLSFEVCSGARGRKEPSLLAEVSGQKGSG